MRAIVVNRAGGKVFAKTPGAASGGRRRPGLHLWDAGRDGRAAREQERQKIFMSLDTLAPAHPAQVAGLFYPAEPARLRALIGDVAKRAGPDGAVDPKVVVAPHAGIVYSGSVAATAFGPWARRAVPPRRIVIVGPAHRYAFRGLALHPAGSWSTPLGEARVAADLHARLASARAAAVDARPFAGEHSLEMHLVMLQALLPEPFEVLPILVGAADPRQVAEALRLVWGGPETVIAVSSDLSHFLDRASAEAIDSDTAQRIETLDAAALESRRACGFLPIAGALDIAAERDMRATGLHLATSADVTGDERSVVGYGAFALEDAASARLAEGDRATLLGAIAHGLRDAAESGGRLRAMASGAVRSPALTATRACFVTLTENGALRGCIGSPAPQRPLIEDAVTNAVRAGFADPRFPPLGPDELAALDVDVSILSHPSPVPASSEGELIDALEPERDGLILGKGPRRALFLPSVWRQAPDARDFVRRLRMKAGVESRTWPEGLEARRFRVESFGAPLAGIEGLPRPH